MTSISSSPTMRIVSLVPSLTHTICEFGLKDQMVGCTKFCVDPTDIHRSATLIGGTKDPNIDGIAGLRPTHIVVNAEENKPEHISACETLAPTFNCLPKSPDDVVSLLKDLGTFLEKKNVGERFASDLTKKLEMLRQLRSDKSQPRPQKFLYLIWKDPWMVAGPDTYISSLLEQIGWVNAVVDRSTRYPTVTATEMAAANADIVLLSSEPYPFRKRDAAALRDLWPQAPKINWIDGKLMSWFGTLTIDALDQLTRVMQGKGHEKFLRPLE